MPVAELQYHIDAEPPYMLLLVDEVEVWRFDNIVDFCYRPVRTRSRTWEAMPMRQTKRETPTLEDLEL